VLAGPHLVLTHAGRHDGVVRCVVSQHVDHILRFEGTALMLLEDQRILRLPVLELGVPIVEWRPLPLGLVGADGLDQLLDDSATVTHDRHVGTSDLAQLRRVDIDMDDLGVGGEGAHLAGDTIVEA
jgi:hypothetical protein